MIGEKDTNALIMGTFHAICSKYLRQYGKLVGLANNFSICDADASKATVAKLLKAKQQRLKDLSLDLNPSAVLSHISKAKSRADTPEDVAAEAEKQNDDVQRFIADVYEEYESALRRNNSLDFDDLLIYGVKLFEGSPHILQGCKHILVDEFQDTSVLQYRLVKLFALTSKCITIVGDPDQSIYGWRAAEIENLAKMQKDFPDTQQIFLEENYRSTGAILAISHAIVSQDKERIDKGLFTIQPSGPKPFIRSCRNEHEEADHMADEIKRLMAYSGGMLNWTDFAILLRYNALSRPIESAFQKHGIPMRMLAGQKFFERAEVKDLLAYLQLADNPDYNPAFVRIVNVPPRSMGNKSIAEVELVAQRKGLSCWAAAEKICAGQVSGNDTRSTNKLRKVLPPFIKVIRTIRELANTGCTVPDLIRRIIELIYYEAYLHKNHSDSDSRWENVQELINFAEEMVDPEAEYVPQPLKPAPKTELVLNDDGSFSEAIEEEDSVVMSETPLRTFLQTSSLSTDTETADDDGEEDKARVTVSTCHAAKGLEWPVVFIPSTEQGTFPFYRTDSVTEERRLLYVACTRAQAFLCLSHVESRMVGGSSTNKECSEFVAPLVKEKKFAEAPPVVDQGVLRLIGSLLGRSMPSDQDIKDKISSYRPLSILPFTSDGPQGFSFAPRSGILPPSDGPAWTPHGGPQPQFSRAATLPRTGPKSLVPLVPTMFSAPAVSVIPGSSKPVSVGSTASNAASGKPVQASVAAYFKPTSTQRMQSPLGSAMSSRSNQNQARATPSVVQPTTRQTASRDIIDLTKDSKPSLASVAAIGQRTVPSKENLPAARPTAPIQLAGGKRRLGMGHIPDGFNSQPNKKLRGPG
ncbi:hypothetical protein M407DRAFT_22412 [Tulasnella calospora MUT 4182]|uniref:DNA 3'-5' helicase n=1 Tax=Tulasnella calospora MUT 4182 TaxID=1051891 RepID=A0A0C3QN15_9AGAM|nr:hypothetical protein M407DRAFT_22412 [Tulasnella calospora MUT 4182]